MDGRVELPWEAAQARLAALEQAYGACLDTLQAMPRTRRYVAQRRAVQERAADIGAEMRRVLEMGR